MKQADASSLLRSELDEFLFAPVGEESNGMTLSVFSALARLGIDPWAEAARLANMLGPAAMHALSQTISGMPGDCWRSVDAPRIAARLVRLLPKGGVAAAPAASRSGAARVWREPSTMMIWLLLAALLVVTVATYRGTIFGSDREEAPISRDSNG